MSSLDPYKLDAPGADGVRAVLAATGTSARAAVVARSRSRGERDD